jgi:hypothetical protein
MLLMNTTNMKMMAMSTSLIFPVALVLVAIATTLSQRLARCVSRLGTFLPLLNEAEKSTLTEWA